MKVMTTALGVLLLGWATGGLSHALHIPPPFAQGGLAVSHLVNDAHGQPRSANPPYSQLTHVLVLCQVLVPVWCWSIG
jgi:hypothetical protein